MSSYERHILNPAKNPSRKSVTHRKYEVVQFGVNHFRLSLAPKNLYTPAHTWNTDIPVRVFGNFRQCTYVRKSFLIEVIYCLTQKYEKDLGLTLSINIPVILGFFKDDFIAVL